MGAEEIFDPPPEQLLKIPQTTDSRTRALILEELILMELILIDRTPSSESTPRGIL